MWWFGIKGVRSCVGSFVECLSANFQPYLLQNVVLGGEGGLPAWLHLLSQCDTHSLQLTHRPPLLMQPVCTNLNEPFLSVSV